MTAKIKEYQLNANNGISSVTFITTPTGVWGGISGTIGDQSDLASLLNAKAPTATLSSAAYTLATNYATSTQGAKADAAAPSATLSSAAYTLLTDYASSTHNITSATHTFPGGTVNFLRADGTFAAPPGGSSGPQLSSVRLTSLIFSTTTSTFALGPLGFTVSNTVAYTFDFRVAYATAVATTGMKIGATFPSVSTFSATVRMPVAAAGPGGEFQGYLISSGAFVTSSTVPLASTRYVAEVIGTILPSANGTLQLTYGTEVAGSAVSTFAGSYGILTTL